MKEASGEANLTVITIILIGVIVAVATPIINSMMTNTAKRTCCTNYGSTVWEGNACYELDPVTGQKKTTKVEDTLYWNKDTKQCVGA